MSLDSYFRPKDEQKARAREPIIKYLGPWEEPCPKCGIIAVVSPDPRKEWLPLQCQMCGWQWKTYRPRNMSIEAFKRREHASQDSTKNRILSPFVSPNKGSAQSDREVRT